MTEPPLADGANDYLRSSRTFTEPSTAPFST
jgi:hypothetical protein